MVFCLSKDAQVNTLMRPKSAGARLTDRRLLSRTSSGFGDLGAEKRGVNTRSY